MNARISTFKEFYAFYLTQHSKMWTRIFHFVTTALILAVILYVLQSGKERFLWYIPILGLGIPWLSHAIFEKNTPTIIKYPLWTIISDVKIFYELITGKEKFK